MQLAINIIVIPAKAGIHDGMQKYVGSVMLSEVEASGFPPSRE